MSAVNGQPPHMIAMQKVTTTEAIMHCANMGVGGLMLPKAPAQCSSATTAPMARVNRLNRIPRTGCDRPAMNAGCFIPQVTPMTISMGMMQIRKLETQPENLAKSKSEMKPIEMAMMTTVA